MNLPHLVPTNPNEDHAITAAIARQADLIACADTRSGPSSSRASCGLPPGWGMIHHSPGRWADLSRFDRFATPRRGAALGSFLETAMTHSPVKAPWHLWLVGVLALLFNTVGVVDFVMTLVQGPAYLASAGMTPAQIDHYQQMPGWMFVVWAVGVFGAMGASALLLMRRRQALPAFLVSLAAFLVSLLYTYGLSNGGAVMGTQMTVTSVVIAVLLGLFSVYARVMATRAVLR
jgi:hypothetical protein